MPFEPMNPSEQHIHEMVTETKPYASNAIAQARAAGVPWVTILMYLLQGLPSLVSFLQGLYTPAPPAPPTTPHA